jgi:lipoate---protein ligase
MTFIESPSTDPYFNLAMEEYVFEKMDKDEQYFILWQNDNTIVIGKHQNTAEEVNQSFVDAHNIHVARRLSGGGAVYHDKGNLNFTFIVDQDQAPDFNFKVFVIPVIEALKKIGIHAEFTGRNDLTIEGMKFSGNSQYAKKGRLLHHGCIMLDSNLTNVADALCVKTAKYESRGIKSVHSRVTCINANTTTPITMENFKNLLKREVFAANTMHSLLFTDNQLDEIQELRNKKYVTWAWNYGASPSYNMKKEKKFSTGLVSIYIQSEKSCIKTIRFFGDFFGNEDLSELEEAMQGLPLDQHLFKTLELLDIGKYMNGITAKDISELILY